MEFNKQLEQAELEAMKQPSDMSQPLEYFNKKQSKKVDERQVEEALLKLNKYKSGKANLESRIIEEEEFWKLRHWENYKRTDDKQRVPYASAYMWNSIVNKHADIMDNYPVASMLPREQSDDQSAKLLSEVIPVIMERNDFEQTYSDAAWYKIKHGTSCMGVFWNSAIDNGVGDIDIRDIDLLNVYWEPGIKDIQDSRDLFIVELTDNDLLEKTYPECAGQLGVGSINIAEYIQDDTVDKSNKSIVVDWYYKKQDYSGRNILHYCKFVNNIVLYASENEPDMENGFYEHGMYPIVFDTMYPEAGTCYGYGIIAVTKQPQLYIDAMDDSIMKHLKNVANPRWWIKKSAGVNEDEFLDETKKLVHCESEINEEKLQRIDVNGIDSAIYSIRQMKIDELKENSNNRDVNTGATSSGVTSGAAIATLQEAGNKTSRDVIQASYRSYVKLVRMVIELIRQFYDEKRSFRIISDNSQQYVSFDNKGIKEQIITNSEGIPITNEMGENLYRKPIFDIDVKAEKRNPYSRLSQNETAANLYNMGVFQPENAQMALIMLELMDFEGKDKVIEYVQQGQTLYNTVQQLMQQNRQLQMMLGKMPQESVSTQPQRRGISKNISSKNPIVSAQREGAKAALNNYGQELVKNSRASAEKGIEGARIK